jgi:AcrR family transcriptional regulator
MATKSKEVVVAEYRIQSIKDAALRVISRKGMAAATMQEIAEEAGIAKGTIYLYFRDRDELVEKTFERAITELHRQVDAALDRDEPFAAKLRSVLMAEMAFFRENREFFRLYNSLKFPEGNPQQQRRQKRTCQPRYRTRLERFARVLEEAMERGEIRRMNAMRLALFINEAVMAIIIERVVEEHPPTEEDDVDWIVSSILDGIRSKG